MDIYVCVCVCVWGGGGGEEGERRKRDDWGIYIIMKKERESVTRYNSQGESVNSPIMIKEEEERFCCKSDTCIQYIYISLFLS